jgi:predicted Zn-dependent protease with MMP-like domain
LARSPSDAFDAAVLDAVDHLHGHGLTEITGIEFAVEDVPTIAVDGPYSPDVLDDAEVPLARAYPNGAAGITSPLIVLYRRPLESRALDGEDLLDLVHEVVVDRVAHLLGRDPGDIDPHFADPFGDE